ncbi:MAG: AraC family transcriptional regulator ligand-binding domain-containing protein [Myxococcota bacterium]|nr:AraC family transcriptional regulator ligand-binding domain-containing protein [Myxococcota bacterium]
MTGHFEPRRLFGEGHGTSALPMPAAYLRLLLRRFGADSEQALCLLEGTGISPEQAQSIDPNATILVWQQLRLLQNIRAFAPPSWALDIGPALHGSAHGALAAAIAAAANLDQALATLERFGHLRSPYFRVSRSTEADQHCVQIEILLEVEMELRRSLIEALLISVQALLESALGEPMSEARFTLPFPAPEYSNRYREALSAPVSYVAEKPVIATLEFPAAWLKLDCPFANESQYQRAKSELEVSERGLAGPDLIVARVEQILEASPDALPSAEEISRRIHLSRRTLVRRLAESGTSFRSIVEGHSRRRAEQLLADHNLTIAEIGHRLGYKDPANFGRAFRRWFGFSPSAHPARR